MRPGTLRCASSVAHRYEAFLCSNHRPTLLRCLSTILDSVSPNGRPADTVLDAVPPDPPAATPEPEMTKTKAMRDEEEIEKRRIVIRDNYLASQRQVKTTGRLGLQPDPKSYRPDAILNNPPRPSGVSLEMLMANQTHMGHSTSLWNPENSRYIVGVRQGIHIINLEETAAHLKRAARVVEEIAYRGGLILFVGNRPGQSQIIAKASDLAGACRLWSKWTPGIITNAAMLLRNSRAMLVDEHDVPVEGFNHYVDDAPHLIPDLVAVMNPLENGPLLHECTLVNVPTIGIIDTNADPTKVTYPIPANDDSLRSVATIALVLGRAGEAGKARRLADAKKGIVTWQTKNKLVNLMQESARGDLDTTGNSGGTPKSQPPKVKGLAQAYEIYGRLQKHFSGEQKLAASEEAKLVDNLSDAISTVVGSKATGQPKAKFGAFDLMQRWNDFGDTKQTAALKNLQTLLMEKESPQIMKRDARGRTITKRVARPKALRTLRQNARHELLSRIRRIRTCPNSKKPPPTQSARIITSPSIFHDNTSKMAQEGASKAEQIRQVKGTEEIIRMQTELASRMARERDATKAQEPNEE